MQNIINIVLPTFIVILIGYIYGRLKKENISSVIDIAMYVALPALVFTSMLEKEIILDQALKIWASALIVMLGCGAIAYLVFALLKKTHSGLYVPIMIMNTVNIPFPIIFLAYGNEGLALATLFYIANSLLLYSLCIKIASKRNTWKEGLKEITKVPLIHIALLSLAFNFGRIRPPELIMSSLTFIGSAAIPLQLIILGVNISRIRLSSLPTAFLASFLRMGVGFGLGILTIILFGLSGLTKNVVLLQSAMPAAVLSSLLTAKYKNEADLVASVVLITTVASIITIPFLLIYLG